MITKRTGVHIQVSMVLMVLALLWGFCTNSCIPRKYLAVEDSAGFHNHIILKFRFRDKERKQSGKIVMKFDQDKAKMLFLSHMNQVYFELFIKKKEAWFVNTKGKKYWSGDFAHLIKEMWNIDISIAELKSLVLNGIVPEKKKRSPGLDFILEHDENSGKLRNIKICSGDIQINLKIQNKTVKSGSILFSLDFRKLKRSDIQAVLNLE